MLGDFVDKVGEGLVAATSDLAKPSRIGVIATAGDRRDEDMVELGTVAADHFDVIVVREDAALRGRVRGDTSNWSRRASVNASCRVRGASRSRSCTTRSRRRGTRWPGPTPATSSSSASTNTPTYWPSSSRWSHRAQAGASASDDDDSVKDPDFA